jgi:hypothetical protein
MPGSGCQVRQLGRHNGHLQSDDEIAETGVKYPNQ